MPYRSWNVSIAAGATVFPLADWQYRYPPGKALLEVCHGASAVGLVQNLTTGPESIVQAESPVGIGFAAGVLPARLNMEVISDPVEPGQEISLGIRNTTGGAVNSSGWVTLTYGK